MIEGYDVTAKGYLSRCAARLRENDLASLFYAAAELRCCVETKLAEYFEHYEPYRKRRVQAFKIGENAKLVRKIIAGEVIAQITVLVEGQAPITFYHTPVPKRLEDYCKNQIDNLRHAQVTYRPPDDPWWAETRDGLIDAYRMAWVACKGDLPLPPLWDVKTRKTHPFIVSLTDDNQEQVRSWQGKEGAIFSMDVKYRETPPSEWVCDL